MTIRNSSDLHTIVEMKFGSHLYGTSTPASDLDIKAVHIPAASDILLQRAKPVVSWKSKSDGTLKNTADDTDFESYSLQKYLALASEGQTVALDMLFAPESAFMQDPSPLWREIQQNRHRLLTCRYASFVGYCRQQANKYGIKGSRMSAARAAVEVLERQVLFRGTTAPLELAHDAILGLAAVHEHIAIEDIPSPGDRMIRHLVVCNRKAPYTSTIKNAHGIYKSLFDEYGKRALAAERNEGVDWKALSHAVRIGHQAIEVLSTGVVTFPRPEAEHLLAIKTGKRPYDAVAEEIETLLSDIETQALVSLLPESPDRDWIDGFIARVYKENVVGSGM